MPLQNHMSNIVMKYGYFGGLKLAHTIMQQNTFQISLLVGADHYWDIAEDHIAQGNGPTTPKNLRLDICFH